MAQYVILVTRTRAVAEEFHKVGDSEVSGFKYDLKYSIRQLRRSPTFTFPVLLTLALSLAVNVTVFSVIYSVLMRPLPIAHPSELLVLDYHQKAGPAETSFSYADFQDIRDQTGGVFSDLILSRNGGVGITVNGKTEPMVTAYVSENFFETLGIAPLLGRFPSPSDWGLINPSPVIVIGYSFWQRHLSSDPAIVGKQVAINGRSALVIGVAPKGFHGLTPFVDVQGYLPIGMGAALGEISSNFAQSHDLKGFSLFARMKPRETFARVNAALNLVSARLSKEQPQNYRDIHFQAIPETHARFGPDAWRIILDLGLLFFILAALVVGIGCVNVTNLVMVRMSNRKREIAIRAALGSSRWRLARMLIGETILLAFIGGLIGILLTVWAVRVINSMPTGTTLPIIFGFHVDWAVLVYALIVTVVVGMVIGVLPLMRLSPKFLNDSLHEAGRTVATGRSRLRDGLVAAETGGALALLIVGALFYRSFKNVQQVNLGFAPTGVLNLTLDPQMTGYDDAQGLAAYNQILRRVRALPGVRSASFAFAVPLGYNTPHASIQIAADENQQTQHRPPVAYNVVSPDYFRTLGISFIKGRDFTDADGKIAPRVAIINKAMAERLWPNLEPVGEKFAFRDDPTHPLQIVGIVANCAMSGIATIAQPMFYVPLAQRYIPAETLQVRSFVRSESLVHPIEEQILAIVPTMPIFNVETMSQALHTLNGLLIFQYGATLAGTLGILGLVLAVAGVYSVMSYSVTQRIHEIGIRMVLGAQKRDVFKLLLHEGLGVVAGGVAAGILAAFAIGQLVRPFLVRVSPTDPASYVGLAAILIVVAAIACYRPVRRAVNVEPASALRHE